MKKRIKIPELLFFQEGPGVRNYQYTTEGVKLLNVANLVNGSLDLSTSERYISDEEAQGKYKHFLCDEGDLIIASSGIKVDYFDKKMGFVKLEHLPLCMNTSTIRFKSLNKDVLDINYFMYFIKSQQFKDQLSRQITGSAQLNFGPSHLNKMEFPLIDMSDQSKIVLQLSKIESIIKMKKDQLSEYDQLIKSRFVEMFGNEKQLVRLSNIATFINGDRGKNYPSQSDIVTEGVPFINAGHLDQNTIQFRQMNYITERKFANLSSGKVQKEDILYCLRGSLGKKALVTFERGAIASSLLILRPNREIIDPIFLLYSLEQPYLITQMNTANNGSSQPNLSAQSVKQFDIILPKKQKQIQFASFVEQVDKLKFEVLKLLKVINKLYL